MNDLTVALVALVFGLGIGFIAARWTSLEHEAEAWGKHLAEWDGSDEQIVFTPDPYDWSLEGSKKLGPDVRIRRRRW